MKQDLIKTNKDPMGAAILEYHQTGKAKRLIVQSSYFDDDEIPVAHLFRTLEEMPTIEQKAMELAHGKVLDVGAGAGCHAIVLQEKGYDVKAIDISELSCQVMKERGIKEVECISLFSEQFTGQFDTILLLMNGSGIVGKVEYLPDFFLKIKQLLAPGGELLIDSSDLRYLYEDEEGNIELPEDEYYGEVDFCMRYKNIKGEPFDWLYVDFITLSDAAMKAGLLCEKIMEGDHYDYLARITSPSRS